MRLRLTACVLAAALFSLGCPGGEGGVGGVLVVANVDVTPGIADVVIGGSQQLTVVAKTASGIVVTGRGVSWSSSDQAIAAVSSSGMVTGRAVGGPVLIHAVIDGVTGNAVITVKPVPVDHVTVTPPSAGVLVNGSVQLTAKAFDAANVELAGRSFFWQSSNSAIAAVTTTGLVLGQAEGGPVTISATSEGKTGSASVSVSTRPPTRLGFLQQPGLAIAGVPFSQPIRVALQDDLLATVIGASNPVTIAIAGNPGGATLSGQTTVTPTNGIASFNTLSLNKVGTAYTFLVTSPGLQSATSDPFDVIAGTANQLAFVTPPSSSAQSGVVFGQQPAVQLKDAQGNNVAQANVAVTASVASGPAGATLGGGTTANTNASGIATFAGLLLSGPVGSYTLAFGGSGITPLPSSPIALSPGPAAALFLATPPSASAQSNTPLPQQPAVQLKDAAGNNVAQSGVVVSAAIGTGPAGSLVGASATTDATGLARFTSLAISGPAGTYTLRFSSGSLTSVTSGSIILGAGGATQLAIVTQPSSSAPSGAPFAQQPAVRLKDASNNNVSQAGVTVTASVSASGTLLGTASVATDAGGLATFTDLGISGLAGQYTLSFSAAGLPQVTSGSITVTAGTASKLTLTRQPSSGASSGVAFAIQPIVQIADAAGNAVSQSGTVVTAAIASGPSGATLTGTPTATTTSAGAATFSNLAISGPSGSYTLRFTSGTLTAVTSGTVTLGAGAPTTMAANSATSQSATVGTAVSAPPSVKVTDASNNPVAGVAVAFAVTSGGGTVVPASPSTVATNSSGIATATSWTLGPAAGTNNNTVTATVTGLSGSPVTFTASGTTGGATQLVITQQPVGGASGALLSTQPTVAIRDAQGNTVTSDNTTQVTVSITSGAGGALGGTLTRTATNGVVTFTNVTLSGIVGTNYVLRFTSTPALTAVNSNNVTVTPGAATQLSITQQPVGGASGAPLSTQPAVAIRDAQGNTVTSDNSTQVTVAITSGAGGALGGTLTRTAVNGVATFTNVTLSGTVGTSYVLRFTSSPALTAVNSNNVTVTPGVATQLVITQQPVGGASGAPLNPQPIVAISDAQGNTVASDNTTQLTVAIFSGSGGSLGGTLTKTASNGVATFTNVTLTGTTGTNYVLRFTSSPALTPANSNNVTLSGSGGATTIAANSATNQSATVGTAVAAPPSVLVTDANGNPVPGVSVAFAVTAGGGTLSPPSPAIIVTGSNGIATVTSWTLGTTAGTNTVSASASVPNGSPVTFNATGTAGAANTIVANSTTSQSAAVGTAVATPPSVKVTDANGNPKAGVAVTFTVTAGGGSTSPASPAVITTSSSGIATLTSWTLGTSAGTNTVTASAGVPNGSPVTFNATGTAAAANAIAANSTTNQSATVGTAVAAPPSVKVTDVNGNPVQGVAVAFVIGAGGGSLNPPSPAAINTDVNGIATLTSWTLGTTAGTNTVTASASVSNGSPVTFTATGTAGPANTIAANSAVSQSATVGSAVSAAPSVLVTDAFGNPKSGVAVTFTVTAGGGSISPASPAVINTNNAGIASLASWTLGPTAGTNNNTVTATASGLSGSPATFTASGTAASPTAIAANSATSQSATVGTAVPAPPSVKVTDAGNNPVAGVAVTFTVTAGGGTISPASPATVNTNSSGIATLTSWTLGPTAGTNNNTVTASATGLSGSPVTFTASGTSGSAGTIAANSAVSQSATVGTSVAAPPSVKVTDANNNPVAGVPVTFTITAGGGSSNPASPATINTDVAGIATLTSWTLGPTAGTNNNTLTATASGLSGSPVTFTASGTVGAANTLSANSPTSQSATVGTAVPNPPSAKVTDAGGNPISGVAVTFTVTAGGGTINPTSPAVINTDVNGIATLTSWTLGTTAGTNTVTASASVPNGSPVSFNATGTAGPASAIAANSATSQTATINTAVAAPPSAKVTDANGNPVSGVAVTFTVTAGGGTTNPASPAVINTNVNGVATLTSWTLGPTVGTDNNTVTASASVPNGSPVTYTASGTSGSANTIAANSAVSQSATVGTAVSNPPSVKVTDSGGNPVSGVAVTFTLTAGGGTLNPPSPATINTDVNGEATLTSWTLGTTAGTNTVTASASVPNGSPVTFNATGTAGPAATIAANSALSQSATVNTAVAAPPSVKVTDANGNPVSGVAVTFTLTAGGGSTNPASPAVINTDVNGLATLTSWTLGTSAGTNNNTVTASASGLSGSPVTFTASATAGSPAQLAYNTQPSSSATSGQPFAQQPVLLVQDAFNNPVPSTTVTATITGSPAGVSFVGTPTATTNASGVATFSGLGLSGPPANYTLTFTAGSASSPASNTITLNSGAPTKLGITTQPVGASSGALLATQPVIAIQDAQGNTVTTDNATQVTAAITSGVGGTLGGTTTVTAVNGVATFTNLTLAGTVGTNYVLRFTSNPVLTAANSNNVTVTPGPATQLGITTQPVGGASGGLLTTQPVIAIQDAQGNTVTTDNATTVMVAIFSGSGGTLGGTTTVTAANGVATFTDLTLSGTVGTDYVLRFTSNPALTAANSNNVTVTPGTATQLSIAREPSNTATANAAFATQPIIHLLDSAGNLVTTANGVSITAVINTSTGNGTLAGTTTITTTNGVATFTNLKITKSGSYTLKFTSPGLPDAISMTTIIVT